MTFNPLARLFRTVKYYHLQERIETAGKEEHSLRCLYLPEEKMAFSRPSHDRQWTHVALPPEEKILLSSNQAMFSLSSGSRFKTYELINHVRNSVLDKQIHQLAELTQQRIEKQAAIERLQNEIARTEGQISKLCSHLEIDSENN